MLHSNKREFVAILRLAGPLIVAQLAHVLMVFTDTVMMAMLGPDELAGGGLGSTTLTRLRGAGRGGACGHRTGARCTPSWARLGTPPPYRSRTLEPGRASQGRNRM